MTSLEEIIETVASGRRVIVEWPVLRNFYFRSDNAINDVKEWADKNGMVVLFNCLEESLLHQVVQDVTFLPKRKAK